jgi:RND family efflux transporter MFP subunit
MLGTRRTPGGVPALVALLVGGCGGGDAPKPAPPATVAGAVKEADLATVTLSESAAKRLGIQTAAIERRRVGRTRTFGGELLVPPGREAFLNAPRSGLLLAPPGGSPPVAGQLVRAGSPVFRLVALASDGDATRLHEEIAIAEARVTNARLRAERAQQLLRDSVGSQQEYDDAAAALAAAEAALGGARARLAVASGTEPGAGAAIPTIIVTSPFTGVVEKVGAAFGQVVGAGVLVVEVAALDSLWVKVPVYVGELAEVQRGAPARVLDAARPQEGAGRTARPVLAPPTADPNAASADLYYALGNRDGAFRAHQRVAVSVPLKGGEDALVVPWSAVVHDVQGGAWVYEARETLVFVRRRVQVAYVTGGSAVLSAGPAVGTRVVTDGAAELFGTEFGAGK